MTIEQMRTEITKAYPGPNWRLSVQGMPNRQVIAVYKRFLETDQFRKARKKKKDLGPPCEQMTIFDLLEKE